MRLVGVFWLAAASIVAACSASRTTAVDSIEALVSAEPRRPAIEVVVAPFDFDGDWYQT